MAEERQFDTKKHPLAAGRVGKLLLTFAIPSIIAMLVGSLYNIADQVFIGWKVGILGNAATNVAFPLMTICMAVSLMFAIGGASNFNLELGRGHKERAGRIVANAISCSAVFGVTISAATLLFLDPVLRAFGATPEVLPYAASYTGIVALGTPFMVMSVCGSHLIRADGSPRYSMCCNLAGALLNIALDPLFIFVFDMGVAGAAWATVISIFVGWLMAASYLLRFKNVEMKREYFAPRLGYVKDIASIGMAACVNQLSMMCVQVTLNNTLTHYGALSDYGANIPLAASGIITKVNLIFMSIVIGLAQGGQPIIGFNYGAGNYARVRHAFAFTLSTATALSLAAFVVFQAFPRQIIDFFGETNEQYYHFVERYFRVFLFMTFINGIQPVTANFFSSIGHATRGLFIALTRQILILIPLLLIFPLFWGIEGIMYAGPISDGTAALIAALFIYWEIRDMRKKEKAAG
ncbi:MAG: MATE family efflux transporter [Synergistaceae bacterium]|jgi:putative MATE family efflux protein|nr:MATE family efflux transporter [Synergistaceae bacterium]